MGQTGEQVWKRIFSETFSRLGAFRPCAYAGQNNPGEGGK